MLVSRRILTLVVLLVAFLSGRALPKQGKFDLPKAQTHLRQLNRVPALPSFKANRTRSDRPFDNNRVLMLMVDFPADDDPTTTGNGKFDLSEYGDPDFDYPLSLGAPPHNAEYFANIALAARYYWLAGSFGQLQLEFTIYPSMAGADAPTAYTMPHPMAYYNPGANSPEFLPRTEEYFADAFAAADANGDIDFSQFDHYVIIHAGSDWQRDVNGDTPGDLPSLHISLADDKVINVNNGQTSIRYAISVPETVAQDGSYGLPTSTLVHELGHSLGLVDLYNTFNFRPMVGWWDIMDSGGSILMAFEGFDGKVYSVEGVLPCLPGAFSRLLAFGEDWFKSRGMLKEITDLDLNKDIRLAPAELPNSFGNNLYFVKIPLNSTEYLLLENRQVDPDGDGGTAMVGALPISGIGDNYRVPLYPTTVDDDGVNDPQNYEYDYFLPGWRDTDYNYYGGGIIVWHVDEKRLYQEGSYDSEGNFVSNYDANTVNIRSSNRAVKIIEADDVYHMGNPYAWEWQGTVYEAFFRDKPILRLANDEYVWEGLPTQIPGQESVPTHNNKLGPTTKPALVDNSGQPSLYKIYDISNVPYVHTYPTTTPRTMTFKIGLNVFEQTVDVPQRDNAFKFNPGDVKQIALNKGVSYIGDMQGELSIATEDSIYVFNQIKYSDGNTWEYFDLNYALPGKLSLPISRAGLPGSGTYNVCVLDSTLYAYFGWDIKTKTMPDKITSTPVNWLDYTYQTKLAVATKKQLLLYNTWNSDPITWDYPNLDLVATRSAVFGLGDDRIVVIETTEDAPKVGPLPASDLLAPLAAIDNNEQDGGTAYALAASGNVYQISQQDASSKLVFKAPATNTGQPTQLALGWQKQNQKAFIAYASGNKAYAFTLAGTMLEHFPVSWEGPEANPNQPLVVVYPDSTAWDNDNWNVVIPLSDGSYKAIAANATQNKGFNLYWNNEVSNVISFAYSPDQDILNMVNIDEAGYLKCNSNSFAPGCEPLLWSGYKNGGSGSIAIIEEQATPSVGKLTAFVYPNPAVNSTRLRVSGHNSAIDIKIYDMSGNKVLNHTIQNPDYPVSEYQIDTHSFSSGVYYVLLSSGSGTKKLPFTVEK